MAKRKRKRRRNPGISGGATTVIAVAAGVAAIATVAVLVQIRANRAIAICNAVGPALGGLIGGREGPGILS